jgi:hypothetical protein
LNEKVFILDYQPKHKRREQMPEGTKFSQISRDFLSLDLLSFPPHQKVFVSRWENYDFS